MMDVVHEVGSNTGNLNLYNVGVADAKQTCCHSALAVHTSKKGHVFEATSASLHAAAEYVWEHLPPSGLATLIITIGALMGV